MSLAPGRPTLIGLGLVTACALAFQVVLTRLFSSVLAYHFSFLAISLSLLGTGAGALLVYVRPALFRQAPLDAQLTRWSAAFAVSLLLLPLLLVRLDLTYVDASDPGFVASMAAACVLSALPPFAAGVVVALTIERFTPWIGSVYAYDLVGAGLGALLIVPMLGLAPAPVLLVALGLLASVSALLFSASRGGRVVAFSTAALGALLLTVSTVTRVFYLPPRYELMPGVEIAGEHWGALARVFGFSHREKHDFAAVFYDRVYAPVPIVRDGRTPDWRTAGTGPQSIGYEITGPGRTLVIGGGGGRDIYTALASGQRPVDVIELIEDIQHVVDVDLGHLSGAPYSREGVHTRIGDGRSLLAGSDVVYDQIHLGFTDTLSANAAQGYALTENNLYTVEAFQEYFDHLRPRGILNVSRLVKLVGDEAMRATVLMLAALERRGIEEPRRHVVVIMGRDILGPAFGTVLGRIEPFAPDELVRIRRLADERGRGIGFAPGGPYVGAWGDLARAPDLRTFVADYPLDISPPTDDRPFFFNMHRWSQIGAGGAAYHYSANPFSVLMLTLAILTALSLVAFVLPLALSMDERPPSLGSLGYFAAIGLGFLLLEIVLIQRFVLFLGYPTYALSVVLFSLLVFSGLGSLLSSRLESARTGMTIALSATVGLIAALAAGLQPLLAALIDLPLPARIAVSSVVLAPVGLCVGMAMPLGLRRLAGLYPTGIAYAWGVNGIASVLASVLGMAIALTLGFTASTLAALACYGLALVHGLVGDWPTPDSSGSPPA